MSCVILVFVCDVLAHQIPVTVCGGKSPENQPLRLFFLGLYVINGGRLFTFMILITLADHNGFEQFCAVYFSKPQISHLLLLPVESDLAYRLN